MQFERLKRREFITLLGGAAALPLTAHAQQRVRRVAVLMSTTPDEPESQARITALAQGLQEAGWTVGSNVRIDVRWSSGNLSRVRRDAEELVALAPDVLVAGIGPTTQEFQRITRTLPIVFTQAVDPVGIGTVKSMARPGGNATGFIQFEYSLSAKWLELLREIVPRVARIGIVRDRIFDGRVAPVSMGQWAAIGAAAAPLGVEILPIDIDGTGDIENAFSEFARGPKDGLIVGVGTAATIQGKLVVALAEQHNLPAVYPYRFFVENGGLISYGPDLIDLYRRSARYVDRILRGERPADLPVQAPTKYQLVINLKTAKALGLEVPPTLLARADEVIE